MLFSFRCPLCQGQLEADDSLSGSQAECPQCGQLVAIPAGQVGEGTTLAGFRLERRLGKGGMGEVYLARQLSVDREVAVKVLPPGFAADGQAVQRFLREGKVAAQLDHGNIATVYEAGEDGGNYYLAMAYIEGESLDRRLAREGALPEKDALRVVRAVADALDYAWGAFGLLHRDIKPANIMVDGRERVFLMDLGLAKRLSEESGMTMSGAVLGTPRYMSPEQALGRSDLGVASDVYSLGATLYHLVVGAPPFDGDSVPRILHQHVYEPLPPPRERNPRLGEGCVRLLEAMLAKRPEDRHVDWRALVADIDRVLAGGQPHAAGTAERSVHDKASLARQAQEALARQHQHEHEHQAAAKAARPAWFCRSAVLVPAVAVVVLLATMAGILASRGGKEAPAKRGQKQQAALPSAEAVPTAEPPAAVETREPPPPALAPEAVPARVPAPADAPEQAPVAEAVPPPAEPSVSRPAPERLILPGRGNWCLAFQEEGACVSIPGLAYDGTHPITIEAVVGSLDAGGKPETVVGSGRMSLARNGVNWQFRLQAPHAAGGVVEVSAPARGPVHVAGVLDGQRQRLYVNGVEVAAVSCIGAGPATRFMVGAEPGATGEAIGDFFRGWIDCVRISRGARYGGGFALEEVLPFRPDEATLCLLDFEEGEGDEAKDSSGHGHHGRIQGATWRRTWPCVLSEERLRELEDAMRQANPAIADLKMSVQALPHGVMLFLNDNLSLADLSPLVGLPVLGLSLARTSVRDLGPLRGMELGVLHVDRWVGPAYVGEGIEDLSPLAGMPLHDLGLAGHPRIRDLSPLRDLPLRSLYLTGTGVSDLEPVAGAPLEVLLVGSPALVDLGPLRRMPLRVLHLGDCPLVRDLEPIAHCRTLEALTLPKEIGVPPAEFQAGLPNLRLLNPVGEEAMAVQRIRWNLIGRIRDEWASSLESEWTAEALAEAASSLSPLAKPILSGRVGDALLSWRANSQRVEGKLTDEQRRAVTAQLEALGRIDEEILASFGADVGKALPVELAAGTATCQILEAGAEGVRVIQTVQRGAMSGRVGRVLRVSDLGVGEKLRRLGAEETPEKNLQRGLLAMGAGRSDIARKLFATAGVPLGEALVAALSDSELRKKESRSRREAEQAGAELLQRLGCSTSLRDRARTVERIRERADGDLRRIGQIRKLLAEFEEKWRDHEAAVPYATVVRQALLHPWPGDEPLVIPGLGMELVPLAPGEFKIAERMVRISRPFWIGKYEVTQEEYAALTGKNPSENKGSRKPVSVNWCQAVEYCRMLTDREGKAERLPNGYEYRLPTDAEWEFACRAGTTERLAGPPDQMGWHVENSGGRLHDVGEKTPNSWGLYDMHGNVNEWCLDLCDPSFRANPPPIDPVNLASASSIRTCRGGSWWEPPGNMASDHYRGWGETGTHAGFRVCLGPEIPLPVAETAVPVSGQQPAKLESKDGWWILFDGKGMDAWQPAGTWTAKDGLLLAPGREQSVLWTKARYADYELDLEFRLEARANSGIYLNDATAGIANHAQYGIEVQLIDDAAYGDLAPEQRCGSIFKRVARRRGAAQPVGEWNRLKVRCRRQQVTVTMNGQKIVDADVLTKQEIRTLQGSDAAKGLALKGDALPPGRIGLQSHGGVVQFRSIRLREL